MRRVGLATRPVPELGRNALNHRSAKSLWRVILVAASRLVRRLLGRHCSEYARRRRYSSAMNTLPTIGALVWFIGLCVLIINTVGDSGTPTVSHVDVLGLGMSVSGAILARGSKA